MPYVYSIVSLPRGVIIHTHSYRRLSEGKYVRLDSAGVGGLRAEGECDVIQGEVGPVSKLVFPLQYHTRIDLYNKM